jgi:dihydrodipicolinate synthase/N-acetylneuraminate lyase
MVIWGIGDRSTRAAELGAKGHTSGIAVVFARASDEINNAQRRGDYETSRRIEADISALEDIRFRNSRVYNYSAVVEAMHLSGFESTLACPLKLLRKFEQPLKISSIITKDNVEG